MKKIILIVLSVAISSCVNREDKAKIKTLTIENKKLSNKIDSLNKKIDFCINGESKIIARIEKNYATEKFELIKKDILLLESKFPASKDLEKYKELYKKIQLTEKKRKAEEAQKKLKQKGLLI